MELRRLGRTALLVTRLGIGMAEARSNVAVGGRRRLAAGDLRVPVVDLRGHP